VANSAVFDLERGLRATAGARPNTPRGPLLRARTRLLRAQLDRHIARGQEGPPDGPLALREAQLVGSRERTRLARRLEQIIAERACPTFTSALPIDRTAVEVAKPILIEVILDLRSSEPVEARGVALGRTLLSDGASPVYETPGVGSGDPDSLWHESLMLLFALRPLAAPAATDPLESQA
jgi:hypothetical protein